MDFDLSLEPRYGVAEKITPRIRRLMAPNPGPFTFRGTGVYIVGAGDHVAVIDPGPDIPAHIEALKRALARYTVSHILITHTHSDHSPAARPLADWSGAPIFGFGAHAQTDEVEAGGRDIFVPDVNVKDGDRIAGADFTFTALHTPGHMANHVCYGLEEDKALFTGDHVMGWSTTVIAPPDGNMGDYLRSLEKVIARGDSILYPTHGSPIPDPENFLHAYLLHRRMREAQIARCLAQGFETVPDIVAKLYRGLSPALTHAAALTVQAHLERLVEEAKASRRGDYFQPIPLP